MVIFLINQEIYYKNNVKFVKSEEYNYIFNMENGFFARWGKNKRDDPEYSPFGPEILDIEVSTICSGSCPWCYKSNTTNGKNMSFETFKLIFDKFPKNLIQIAFGIGDLDANQDLWKMFEYCQKNQVVPNITINGYKINEKWAKRLAKYCGAVAVSHYNDEYCFNAVELLINVGIKQVNIHKLVTKETLKGCYDLIDKTKNDVRLSSLNAIILLSLKQKGRGKDFHAISQVEFSDLVQYALNQKISIGFDSCSAKKFLKIIQNNEKKKFLEMMIESCESNCFSQYINVEGIAYPCSFLEGELMYEGIDVIKVNNFIDDIWFNEKIKRFRKKLIRNKRICPVFKI